MSNNTYAILQYELTLEAFLVICSYFVYHSIPMAVAFLALSLFYDLLIVFSLIPIIGVIISGLLMYFWATPFIFSLTGLTQSWIVGLLFWVDITIGIAVSLILGIYIIIKVID